MRKKRVFPCQRVTERPPCAQKRAATAPQARGARRGRRQGKRQRSRTKGTEAKSHHARADAYEVSQETIPTLSNDSRPVRGVLTGPLRGGGQESVI